MRKDRHGSEKRGTARVCARGGVVFHGEVCDRGAIVDLSETGLRARLDGGSAEYRAGDHVAFELRLDGADGRWSELTGQVLRLDVGGDLVVKLDEPPPDFDDAVQEELLAVLESQAVVHVLIVDPLASRRTRLAAALRATGKRVCEAATPLEAIAHLGESRAHPDSIAIADTVPPGVADELRAYMSTEHACLRVVRADRC